MRTIVTVAAGLLAAGALAAGAAPAAAIETGMCRINDNQIACTYCSYEGSQFPSNGQQCKDKEPGYDWTLCLVWHEVQCLAGV